MHIFLAHVCWAGIVRLLEVRLTSPVLILLSVQSGFLLEGICEGGGGCFLHGGVVRIIINRLVVCKLEGFNLFVKSARMALLKLFFLTMKALAMNIRGLDVHQVAFQFHTHSLMELLLNQVFHFVTDRTPHGWSWNSYSFIVPVAEGVYLEAMTLVLLKVV